MRTSASELLQVRHLDLCEPTDDWLCKYDQSPEPGARCRRINVDAYQPAGNTISPGASEKQESDFTFPCGRAHPMCSVSSKAK